VVIRRTETSDNPDILLASHENEARSRLIATAARSHSGYAHGLDVRHEPGPKHHRQRPVQHPFALMGRSGETRQVQVAANRSQYRDSVRAVPVKAAVTRPLVATATVA
jgi:hypothetical protein